MDQIPPHFLDLLCWLYDALPGPQVNWALTGSLSFALQGMPLTPADIDIQTDQAGAYEIECRLAAYVVSPVYLRETARLRSYFARLQIDHVTIEVIGALQKRAPGGQWEPPPDLNAIRRRVPLRGRQIPVLDLAYEAEAYARMGRLERAVALRAWVAAHQDTS